MSELMPAARTAVETCLSLSNSELCIIVSDDPCREVADALYQAACEVTMDTSIIQYPPRSRSGEEPPTHVSAAMQAADVIFAPTSKSISHTQARSQANRAGARMASLPGITPDLFSEGLDADYHAIADESERLFHQIKDANEIHVTSTAGTDIVFELGSQEWTQDTGIIHESGSFSNLPAGEVFISPESATGTYVVDGSMPPHGLLAEGETIEIQVEDGFITKISDDQVREEVEAAADEVGEAAYNIAELGIGSNIGVSSLSGSVLMDEKIAGTAHIALGDDHAIGGTTEAPIHLDGILREPHIFADGTEIRLPPSN